MAVCLYKKCSPLSRSRPNGAEMVNRSADHTSTLDRLYVTLYIIILKYHLIIICICNSPLLQSLEFPVLYLSQLTL